MFERLATNALALILNRLGLDWGPSRVGASIERVLNAALPEGHSIEIVAVDDGSTDSSVEVVEQLTQRYSQIRLAIGEGLAGPNLAPEHPIQLGSIQNASLPGLRA